MANAFDDLDEGRHVLRELTLLRCLRHDNVVRMRCILPPASPRFEDVYVITEMMDTDLHRVIYSKQELLEEHQSKMMYQILRALVYLHAASVVHRDLKPSNVLVDKEFGVKICDFGS